jgi:hypothetical protein
MVSGSIEGEPEPFADLEKRLEPGGVRPGLGPFSAIESPGDAEQVPDGFSGRL